MGVEVEIIVDHARIRPDASEVDRLFAGTELAQKLFGWTPEHGSEDGFVKGLAETAEWFQDPSNLAVYKVDQYNI